METKLSGNHQKIYQRVFEHPMAHNLQWREVWSMLKAIADVNAVEDDNRNIKITRNGQTLTLHRPRGKDLADKKELMQIRNFLERSGVSAPPPPAKVGAHLLVVIDHREARIYQAELQGSVPQRITPYDPQGFGRQLHYVQDDSNGQRKPERKSFYEAVAKTLENADQILVFGAGTGASSAMEQLLIDLKAHHHMVADRVIGSHVIDEKHVTENQLLATAREYFAAAVAPVPK